METYSTGLYVVYCTKTIKNDPPRQLNFRADKLQDFLGRGPLDLLRPQRRDRLLQDAAPERNEVTCPDHEAVHELQDNGQALMS